MFPKLKRLRLHACCARGKFGTCLRDFVQMAGLALGRTVFARSMTIAFLPMRQNVSQAKRVMRKYRDVLVDCPHPKSDG